MFKRKWERCRVLRKNLSGKGALWCFVGFFSLIFKQVEIYLSINPEIDTWGINTIEISGKEEVNNSMIAEEIVIHPQTVQDIFPLEIEEMRITVVIIIVIPTQIGKPHSLGRGIPEECISCMPVYRRLKILLEYAPVILQLDEKSPEPEPDEWRCHNVLLKPDGMGIFMQLTSLMMVVIIKFIVEMLKDVMLEAYSSQKLLWMFLGIKFGPVNVGNKFELLS